MGLWAHQDPRTSAYTLFEFPEKLSLHLQSEDLEAIANGSTEYNCPSFNSGQ